jgi:hypothetical protein
MTPS